MYLRIPKTHILAHDFMEAAAPCDFFPSDFHTWLQQVQAANPLRWKIEHQES